MRGSSRALTCPLIERRQLDAWRFLWSSSYSPAIFDPVRCPGPLPLRSTCMPLARVASEISIASLRGLLSIRDLFESWRSRAVSPMDENLDELYRDRSDVIGAPFSSTLDVVNPALRLQLRAEAGVQIVTKAVRSRCRHGLRCLTFWQDAPRGDYDVRDVSAPQTSWR